jgi:polyisoprenoid-binding protein YceI
MKTISLLRPFALAGVLLASVPALAADYVQAAGSTLAFASSYDGKIFVGSFPGFSTTLRFDPADLGSARLDVAIPLAGTRSGNGDRDATLRGPDFLDTARFASARYHAEKFRALGGDRYAADGILDLHGVSKPVTLTFTWTPGTQPVLAGKATVKRLDFGVGQGDWADTGAIPDAVAVSTRVVLKPAD